MSSQKGNTQRKRPQKYKNQYAFKNTLHDTSHKTKAINNTEITHVCDRCRSIIEWKIKYKKYKPLSAPSRCNKCKEKAIKHAYRTICNPCAKESKSCSKCGESFDTEFAPTKQEEIKLDLEMQKMLQELPERKRRTFIRFMNNKTKDKSKKKNKSEKSNKEQGKENKDQKRPENSIPNDEEEESDVDSENIESSTEEEEEAVTREQLIDKLKSLSVKRDEDDFDSDFSSDLE